jgi:hypothetical protein
MRRVDCRRCEAVVVEEVPWGDGKRTLTNAYMLFLARWARRLSWKETAEAFHTSWEKVFDAVEHVVTGHFLNPFSLCVLRTPGVLTPVVGALGERRVFQYLSEFGFRSVVSGKRGFGDDSSTT